MFCVNLIKIICSDALELNNGHVKFVFKSPTVGP